MEIVTPGIGLIFWTSISFLIVVFIVGRFAVKPISEALKEREDSIDQALKASEAAKSEVEGLKASIEQMKKEARVEKEKLLADAKNEANKMIAEAQEKAKAEVSRMMSSAQESIRAEKDAAISKVKGEVGKIAVTIAETLLKKELNDKNVQDELVAKLLKEANLN
jgi:F-type H+-transporting ATPase subunit b